MATTVGTLEHDNACRVYHWTGSPTHGNYREDTRTFQRRLADEVSDIGGGDDQRNFGQRIDDARDDLLQDPSAQKAPQSRQEGHIDQK